MTDVSQTMGRAPRRMPAAAFRPWRNTAPAGPRFVPGPAEDLSSRAADFSPSRRASRAIASWRAFSALSAIERRPGELRSFLKTLPLANRARPALPLGPVSAPRIGLDFRFVNVAMQPTLAEILVAAGVMLVTAALALWIIVAAAG